MKSGKLLCCCLLFLIACQSEPSTDAQSSVVRISETKRTLADSIVNQTIIQHGGALYDNSLIRFTFRERQYKARRQGSSFEYERIFTDTSGRQIRDVLNNGGLYREINGQRASLSAKDSSAYANSVNSVLYFALLPAPLNDRAAIREYLGETTLKGKPYHKIRVTFRQEGGGKDFEDEYVYWIHRDEQTMDYLAYNYQTDGGGARFREAYNVREINGIRFADYINYKPKDPANLQVATFDQLFANGELEELSRIDSENVEVIVLNN
ncbi:MAG TPA: hypothetical protein PKC76_01390 [Saprospiraceae bacterium]|nr:hypothetical protein [Saprospiraceae bacterium]HMP22748.1 hypothetical protein [Saprospiraceae bacterium]